MASQSREAIETAASAYAHMYGCGDTEKQRLRRAASRRLAALALAGRQAGASLGETIERLRAAVQVAQAWPSLMALADHLVLARDFAGATQSYQKALNDMAAPHPNEAAATPAERDFAYQRANETQMLAPDETSPVDRAGEPGGLDAAFARGARDIKVVLRYLPLTFLDNSTEMTGQGRAYAEQWLQSIRGGPDLTLILIGHADPRGTDRRNDELSVARARSVAAFLKSQGLKGQIKPVGMGRRCPVEFSPGSAYTQAEQYQIMRRVEVLRGAELPPAYCHGQPPVGGS